MTLFDVVEIFSYHARLVVQDLLATLPEQHKDTTVYECAIGAAMLASMDTLVCAQQSTFPY